MQIRNPVLRIVVLVVAVLVDLVIAGAILIHTPPAKKYLRAKAGEYVHRRYGAELQMDHLGFSLLKGSVSVTGLRLRSDAARDLAPLLQVKQAYVDLDLIPTLFGMTSIERARIRDAEINIVVEKDGRKNLPDFGGGGGGGLLIRDLRIEGGRLNVDDRRQQIGLQLPSWQLRIQGRALGFLNQIELKTNKSGVVSYRGNQFKVSNIDLDAEVSTRGLTIRKLDLIAAGSRARGSGSVRNFSRPVVDLKIETEIDLAEAAAALGLMPGVKGTARGTITVTGPIGDLRIGGTLQGSVASVAAGKQGTRSALKCAHIPASVSVKMGVPPAP